MFLNSKATNMTTKYPINPYCMWYDIDIKANSKGWDTTENCREIHPVRYEAACPILPYLPNLAPSFLRAQIEVKCYFGCWFVSECLWFLPHWCVCSLYVLYTWVEHKWMHVCCCRWCSDVTVIIWWWARRARAAQMVSRQGSSSVTAPLPSVFTDGEQEIKREGRDTSHDGDNYWTCKHVHILRSLKQGQWYRIIYCKDFIHWF